MNKLSFRARALDASKPMPIFMSEELPDLPEYSAINRAVPQMPSGMEKEEECEHHLQRAICTGIIIPTPEVYDIVDDAAYDMLYPPDYKMPKQLIHMQPFLIDQEVPEYDMDSEDEVWVKEQSKKMDISPIKFEEMMDRLEKGCGQTVLELNEAKTLLKEDDDLTVAVYDYWLTKRLNTLQPLIPQVKTEARVPTTATNNPYLAFRRRTEKMQTRKNRKNDEASYEKMLKLRRDLYRAITLLELVKRREKYKRENLHLAIEIYEKRYQAQDFSGSIVNELSAAKPPRPAFTQLYNHLNHNWVHKMPPPKVSPVAVKEDLNSRKEKRQYKKRKHRSGQGTPTINRGSALLESSTLPASSEDESYEPHGGLASDTEEEVDSDGPYAFKRRKNCDGFLAPKTLGNGNWPWTSKEEGGNADVKFRYTLGSIRRPTPMTVGFVRRRLGRGGRVILDRASTSLDDYWSNLDFTVFDSEARKLPAAVEAAPPAAAAAAIVPPASPGPSTALPPLTAAVSVPTSPSKPSTSTAPPLPSPPVEKSDAELLGDLTADWLHFCPIYDGGDEFSDCQLPFEELDVEETDFETAPSQPEPNTDLDFSELSSSKFSVIDASSYVPPKPVSPIPSTSSVVLPPPPAPPPLKTQRLALKDRIYQLQNNRGTTPNGPHSVKATTGIPQPNNTSSPAAVTALSPLTPSWTSDVPTSSRLTKPVQPSSTAEPALPGEGGAEMKKESQIPDEQSVEAILRHVMEVT